MPKPELVLCQGFGGVTSYAIKTLTKWGSNNLLDISQCVVMVPTAAAKELFVSQLEDSLLRHNGVIILPTVSTPSELVEELSVLSQKHLRIAKPLLREALLEKAFEKVAQTIAPPFEIRGSLARRVLQFYDQLRLNRTTLETFTKRAQEEFDIPDDQGAQKMTSQTDFLNASLILYENSLSQLSYCDPIAVREKLYVERFPYKQVIALGSETLKLFDIYCLQQSHELVTLEIALEENDTVLQTKLRHTAATIRSSVIEGKSPSLLTKEHIVARDREDSMLDAARIINYVNINPERIAIVVPHPLPYMYLAKKVLKEAQIPYQLHDMFPLATEPYMATVDLTLMFVEKDASRKASIELLRNPFFSFNGVGQNEVNTFDAFTLRYRGIGGYKQWLRLYKNNNRLPTQPALPNSEMRNEVERILPALKSILNICKTLKTMKSTSSLSEKITCLRTFLSENTKTNRDDRHHHVQTEIDSILHQFEKATRLAGDREVDFKTFRYKLKLAFETQMLNEQTDARGVNVVDARSAGFGRFDLVLLLGVNDDEWPTREKRSIFYPQWLLREFGWPSDRELLFNELNRFKNLLKLSKKTVALLRHQLENSIPTVASPFLEEVTGWLNPISQKHTPQINTSKIRNLVVTRSEGLRQNLIKPLATSPFQKKAGIINTPPAVPTPISTTAFELYLRCPFKYFSSQLLKLREEEDPNSTLTPLERGRLLHEILEKGFRNWDAGNKKPRSINIDNYGEALELFRKIAEEKIPSKHKVTEMPRLFGTGFDAGDLEWLLRWEITRGTLKKRLVEHSFTTRLPISIGPRGEKPWSIDIRGRIDRVDINEMNEIDVFDYKTGRAPDSATTIQVPIYALCLSEEFASKINEAAYLSFRDRKKISRMDFNRAKELVVKTFESIQNGVFNPKPYRDHLCVSCGFIDVCRKEFLEKE